MAKIKASQERPEKKNEIMLVARRLFLEKGYDGSSMSRIAEEAGIAPNTIYWYFVDKDALLTAVLDSLVEDGVRDFRHRKKATREAQVLWLLGVFDSLTVLIATVHARVLQSEVVRTWHENFHKMIEAALTVELRAQGVPEGDLQHASRVAMFVFEGLLAHPSSTQDRSALIRWLITTLERSLSGKTSSARRKL